MANENASEYGFRTFKSRFTSDFNPGVSEFERLDGLKRNCDQLGFACASLEREAVIHYVNMVFRLFAFVYPTILLSKGVKFANGMKNEIDTLYLEALDYNKMFSLDKKISFPLGLYKRISDYELYLLYLIQVMGFGLRMTKSEAVKTTVRRYLKAGGGYDKRFDKEIKLG